MPYKNDNTRNIIAKITSLESIIKYSPVMIYWKNKSSIYLGCNQNFIEIVGYANCSDVIGKTDYDLSWYTQAEKFQLDDQEVIRTGHPKLNIEDVIINKNGQKGWVITNKVPLFDDNQEIIGVLGIATDITERKIIENELRASKTTQAEYEMLNSIIKYSPDWIYWKDKNSVHLGSNEQFAKAAGLSSREEMVGKTDYDFPWSSRADKYRLDDQEVINSGVPKLNIEDTVLINNEKEVVVISNKVPLRGKEGEIIGILGIATDITQQKNTENALKIAKEAAEAADIAKTEFIANMSHDIRTPLSGVVGLGGIVEQEIDNPAIKAKVHDMVKSAEELLNMLNEILDVVSATDITVDDIHEEPFDLPHLLQSIIDLEQSSLDFKKITIRHAIENTIPVVLFGDHKKIHHILLNLVGNAIKFTKIGHVGIAVSLLEKSADGVRLLFEVSDTGMGIPADAVPKVFDLFYKITPSYKGLDKGHGVGLHIVKTYTELLGGHVSVESKLNKGTTFSVTLSLKIPDVHAQAQNIHTNSLSERSEASSTEIEALSPNTQTAPHILIIEDNRVALMMAEHLVHKAQCKLTSAIDGESALELAKTKAFDLILSDVGLPGISGIEFAQQLRQYEKEQHKKSVPIVAITGHAEGKFYDECMLAGMNDVLLKPIRADMLTELCQRFSLFDGPKQVLHSSQDELVTAGPLGMDLPDTEAQLFQLHHLTLLDSALAMKELGNNKALFITVLTSFIELFPAEKQAIEGAYKAKDWNQVETLAHKMKGGTVYLKLMRLSTACQYMERYHKAGHTERLDALYQQMISIMDETAVVVAQWLQKNQ